MTELGKVPVQNGAVPAVTQGWQPFENLKQEVDRLFDEFDSGFWRTPFRRSLFGFETPRARAMVAAPATDVTEKDGAYDIAVELPGMEEKDIDVSVANGMLTIKGEKKQEKEEKRKDYYLSERRYGSFERTFGLPDGVDTDKIAANFKKGVLTITLPKTPEAQKQEKKIAVKPA